MSTAPIFAAAVVLLAAASGSGDYVLVLPERGVAAGSCAKSAETCEAARRAALAGWLPGVPAGTQGRCEPRPECFAPSSNTIPGFNAPASKGERR